jgi:hypothetical protein
MAQPSHYVMAHTATSITLSQDGQPTKKQYGLKAGLKRFTDRGDAAVMKELTQCHAIKVFCPCDHRALTREDRRNDSHPSCF